MAYLTRGVRQLFIDVWTTKKPPVMVRGNWKNPAAPHSPKRFWLPADRVTATACKMLHGRVPKTGECLRINR